MNALKAFFGRDDIECCLFHLKQAWKAYLRNIIRMDREIISDLLDLLEILTVIPVEEIRTKGIPFVLSHFDLMDDSDKWYKFYEYFVRTWCVRYSPMVR